MYLWVHFGYPKGTRPQVAAAAVAPAAGAGAALRCGATLSTVDTRAREAVQDINVDMRPEKSPCMNGGGGAGAALRGGAAPAPDKGILTAGGGGGAGAIEVASNHGVDIY